MKAAVVTLDVEYVDSEGQQDVPMKAFTTEILQIVSQDCLKDVTNGTEVEEKIENMLPIKCRFKLGKDKNGQVKISQVSDVNHNCMV